MLVERRLAACVQIHGPITSTYRWEGAVETTAEWACQIKTVRRLIPALESELRRHHPYRTPELIALPIVAGGADYLRWMNEAVSPAE